LVVKIKKENRTHRAAKKISGHSVRTIAVVKVITANKTQIRAKSVWEDMGDLSEQSKIALHRPHRPVGRDLNQ
jgi:hypothetical protein